MALQEIVTVLRVVPYPIEENGGVARNAMEGIPYLESNGIISTVAGPYKRGISPDPNVIHFGRSLMSIPHDGTRNDIPFASSASASSLLHQVKSDIVHQDEPAAGFGQLFPLLVESPRRHDGQRIPAFGATVHARLEDDKLRFRAAKALGYMPIPARRGRFPEFHRLSVFIPNSLRGRLIAVSKGTADYWEQKFPGNYEVIYNGIDTSMFNPNGPLIQKWLDGKKTIFMAGRHDKRKGMDIGIMAFARLRNVRDDIKLKIAGKGSKTQELGRLVERLHVPDVEFTGMLDSDELPKAYRTADVFVSPATGGEGFGRVLAEALACGTPTVGSDIPGYQEAMQKRPFTRMPHSGDVEGFTQAISEFLDISDELRKLWKNVTHNYIEVNFGWNVIAPKQADVYRKWLDQHGRTPKSQWPERKASRRFPRPHLPRRGLVFGKKR